MTTTFILTFALFAFAAVGVGELYLFAIRPGQFMGFMQRPLVALQGRTGAGWQFLYKSIGGCRVCTIQRFADLTFLLLMILHPQPVWLGFILYCLFGGLVFYALSRGGDSAGKPAVEEIVHSQNLDL